LASDYPVKLIPHPAIEEEMSQLRATCQNLAQILGDVRFTLGTYEKAAALRQKIDARLDIIERTISAALADSAESIPFAGWNCYDFGRTFKSASAAGALAEAGTCNICGGPLLRQVNEYHLDPSIQRQLDLCLHCGPQRDAPPESGLQLFIGGPSYIKLNMPFTQDVHLHNTKSSPISGTVALRIGKLKPFRRLIEPEFYQFTLQADEHAVYPFRFELNEGVLPHAQFAKAVVIENFRFIYSSRPIWIEP
jgi:hypothetical protein